jgi:hypothetical protein
MKDEKHLLTRMNERNITLDNLQRYINGSMFMFQQSSDHGARRLYVSADGGTVIQVNGRVITVYSAKDFDKNKITKIIEEVRPWLRKKQE